MEAAITKVVKEETEKLNLESKNREELQKKAFMGERNVLATQINPPVASFSRTGNLPKP